MKRFISIVVALAMLCVVLTACQPKNDTLTPEKLKEDVISLLDSIASGDYSAISDVISTDDNKLSIPTAFSGTVSLSTEGMSYSGIPLLEKMSLSVTAKQNKDTEYAKVEYIAADDTFSLEAYKANGNLLVSDGESFKKLVSYGDELSEISALQDTLSHAASALSAAVKSVPTECIDISETNFKLTLTAEQLKAAVEAFIAEGESNGLKAMYEDEWNELCDELRDIDDENVFVLECSSSELGYSFTVAYGDDVFSITPKQSENDQNVVEYIATVDGETEKIAEVTAINTSTAQGKSLTVYIGDENTLTCKDVQYNGDSGYGSKHVYEVSASEYGKEVMSLTYWEYAGDNGETVLHCDIASDGSTITLDGIAKDTGFDGTLDLLGAMKFKIHAEVTSTDKKFNADIVISSEDSDISGEINIKVDFDLTAPVINVPESAGEMTYEEFGESLSAIFGFGGDDDYDWDDEDYDWGD